MKSNSKLTPQVTQRDMSPIGECPSSDETDDEQRRVGGHNDSIVTDALLRMTGL
jgi:hypothetical protein